MITGDKGRWEEGFAPARCGSVPFQGDVDIVVQFKFTGDVRYTLE